MKKQFIEPSVEIIEILNDEIVVCSGGGGGDLPPDINGDLPPDING